MAKVKVDFEKPLISTAGATAYEFVKRIDGEFGFLVRPSSANKNGSKAGVRHSDQYGRNAVGLQFIKNVGVNLREASANADLNDILERVERLERTQKFILTNTGLEMQDDGADAGESFTI